MTTTANENYATGYVVGTGAAIDVSIGWIPRKVHVTNLTDGTKITQASLDKMIAFTSGGTVVPVAGNTITGITGGATAKIKQVILISGTFAAGDAAGYFVCDAEDCVGVFGTENVTVSGSAAAQNDASVVAAVELGVSIDTEVASETGNAGILSYVGSAGTYAKGFTLGSTISVSAKLLKWEAWR